MDLNTGNFHIGDGTKGRYIFNSNGDFTAKGDFFTFGDGAGAQTMRIVCDDYDYWDIKSRVGTTDSLHIRAYNKGALQLYTNGSKKLETTNNGITVTGTVTETSDARQKTNIVPIDGALSKIQQVTGYTYNWKDSNVPDIGVIAQDVEQVFPELVETENEGEEDEIKSVGYSGLVGVLIEAVKELSETVTELRAEVNELKGNT